MGRIDPASPAAAPGSAPTAESGRRLPPLEFGILLVVGRHPKLSTRPQQEVQTWLMPSIQMFHLAERDAWSVSNLGVGGSIYDDVPSAAILGAVTIR